jgi:mannan polymerase II complex MNN10 subunit
MVYVDNDIESNLKYKPKSRTSLNFQYVLVILNKFKKILILLVSLIFLSLFTNIPLIPHFRLSGPKVVIILAANEGGGVLNWKGAQEWSIERSSIANKKDYAERHGYALAIKDLTMKKRYSHEWRESWEKVDILKQTFRQYPNAEWFWWLDLHTYIMEPEISLEEHIFNQIDNITERQLYDFNPLGIQTDIPYVDYSRNPIDMLITQDCGGFNLGSFLIRKSDWSQALLDSWWDPVFYEQMHMEWEHKEQDCLETLYTKQAWIRERVGFIPLRKINSFPPGACSQEANDPRYFYNEKSRDFIVNMAGCDWGRDCWNEMAHYKALSRRLHKPWYKFW